MTNFVIQSHYENICFSSVHLFLYLDAKPRERPKLNLLPRTVPRDSETPSRPADGAALDDKPEKAAPKPVSAEKVFGAAKPVDTAAK